MTLVTTATTSQDLLLAHFDAIAAAPGGINRLRQLILQLAVQGRLVAQDPQDEPATTILRKINLSSGSQERSNIEDEVFQPNYLLPPSWKWAYFDEIADFKAGKTPPTKEAKYWSETGIPWVSISDMPANGMVLETSRKITPIAAIEVFRGSISPSGTLLMSFKLTIGKVSLLGVDAYHNEAIISIFPKTVVTQEYLVRFLPILATQGNTKNAIKGSTLNKDSISKILIPLPPLAEQRRIVARVDTLMALCDALEQRQARQDAERRRLLGALVAGLSNAGDAATVAAAWARLSASFDLVLAAPEDVAPLRQAVLQLAVQGRLVEQDPKDEPASVLLERIRTEKARLLKEGRLKKVEPVEPITEEEQPFIVPNRWEWARFSSIAVIASNLVKPQEFGQMPHIAPDNIEKQTGQLLDYQTIAEDGVTSPKHQFFLGQILYSKIRPNLSKVVVASFNGLCSADMYPIDAHIDTFFLWKYMLSSPFLDQSVKKDTRVAMPKINQEELNRILVPVPPLAEQRRIVARVEQLMALCDTLEARLREERAAAEQLSAALCDAVAAGTLPGHQEAVVLELPERQAVVVPPVEAEAILLAFALQMHLGTPTERSFGKVKAEKTVHLIEAISQRDLGRYPRQWDYGPADPEQLERAIEVGQNWKSFKVISREQVHVGYQFVPDIRLSESAARLSDAFGSQTAEVTRLINLLVPLSSRQAEAVATLYAVWNDMLRIGVKPENDERIFTAFRAFHPRKEHFDPEMLRRWLNWMREHGLGPDGSAKPTKPFSGRTAAEPIDVAAYSAGQRTPALCAAENSNDYNANSNDNYDAAVALLAQRGALTNSELQAALGIDATTARALLKRLVAEGRARQEGQRRGARYVVVPGTWLA